MASLLKWTVDCVCVCLWMCECVWDGWVAACLFVRAGLFTKSSHQSRFSWREQQHLSADVYCKALTWQNHSSLNRLGSARLGSAPLHFFWCITVTLEANTRRCCLTFLFFILYISVRQATVFLLGSEQAQHRRLWCTFCYFFDTLLFIFFDSGCSEEEALLCVTQMFCFLLHCCWIRMNMYVNIGLLQLTNTNM